MLTNVAKSEQTSAKMYLIVETVKLSFKVLQVSKQMFWHLRISNTHK